MSLRCKVGLFWYLLSFLNRNLTISNIRYDKWLFWHMDDEGRRGTAKSDVEVSLLLFAALLQNTQLYLLQHHLSLVITAILTADRACGNRLDRPIIPTCLLTILFAEAFNQLLLISLLYELCSRFNYFWPVWINCICYLFLVLLDISLQVFVFRVELVTLIFFPSLLRPLLT